MKSQSDARLRAHAAHLDFERARLRLLRDASPLRQAFRRRRAAWIVGGGLAAGFAVGIFPVKLFSRIGGLLGGSAAALARAVVAPIVAGVIFGPAQASQPAAPEPARE